MALLILERVRNLRLNPAFEYQYWPLDELPQSLYLPASGRSKTDLASYVEFRLVKHERGGWPRYLERC